MRGTVNRSRSAIRIVAAFVVSSTAALAQGSDGCVQAQAIAGVGTFAFDNGAATTDASSASCAMEHDVWFRWTSQASGAVTVTTCGGTNVDTALAVYDGTTCPPGAPLGCGDDQCGLQSELVFTAVAGSEYLIQVGTWAFANGGTGTLEILAGGSVGGCDDASVGPNVIAGEIGDAVSWGDLNGVSAYSFATTACNVGDDELLWIGNSNQHPVVMHSLYRLENGRFLQLGTSWVKHGFGALQRDLCCVCIPSANISALGVGCSDPYSASLNGLQSGLGPPSEVDAFTGQFPWPHGNSSGVPPASTILDRRLQVGTNAVSPTLHPNARYFVETVYVTPDDAGAGNSFDNASYREFVRTGTTTQGAHDLAPASVTERAVPALMAWATETGSALVREVRVPGEGAYWVGSNVVPRGASRWRYEYTVFNLNSSRDAAAFVVPAGVMPGAASMWYPRAHSGDAKANVSWSQQLAGDRYVWSAPGFDSDPNANVVRWGTAYSFWFESSSAPVERAGSLVLRGAGGPTTLFVPIMAPKDAGAPHTSSMCDAVANSSGVNGELLLGEFDGAGQSMVLTATGLPVGSVGYVLASRVPGFTPLAGGSAGNLCLGGAIGRFVGGGGARLVVANGSFAVSADLTALPQPMGAEAVQAGETWYFQAWHRDAVGGVATSNFTSALRASF